MFAKSALHYESLAIVYASLFVIGLVIYKRQVRAYAWLVASLSVNCVFCVAEVALLYHRRQLGLPIQLAYNSYFYIYWSTAILQMFLQLGLVYSMYRIVMKPMEGLRHLGNLVFLWAAGISLLLSVMVAMGPHFSAGGASAKLISQAQQGEATLITCLLLFVCFAARPLGLSYRSRAFGILLGLGFSSTASLVLSSWASTQSGMSVYAAPYAWGAAISLLTLCIWGTYFVVPEPERKLVTLPTTSPYFHWNAISKALRVSPGEVAVSGFTPSFLAKGELAALKVAQKGSSGQQLNLPKHEVQALMNGTRAR